MKKIKLRKQRLKTIKVYPAEIIFNEWLDNNIHRFKHKPILKKIINGYSTYLFKGIIDRIELSIDFSRPESMLNFYSLPEYTESVDDIFFDQYVIEYIGDEKHDLLKGYYDTDKIDNIYDYFPTQKELYVNNVFEPIVEYCNKMLISANSLYLFNYSGSTEGFIAPKDTSKQSWVTQRTYRFNISKNNKNLKCVSVFTDKNGYMMYKYDLFCV